MTITKGRPATQGVIPGLFGLSVGQPPTPAPNGWRWVKLSDVARLESGHTPSRRVTEYWDGDIPWIGIRDATENHGEIIYDTYQHVTELGIQNSSARVLPTNTVCLSRTASIGYVVVMGRPMATSQDFVNWVCSEEIDYRYLKAVLLAERDSFPRFASGTTHQTIYYPEVKAFHVCLPKLPEQQRVVSVLEALQDRIELNRRMNHTLEEMAQAIFKSWFVDFDGQTEFEDSGTELGEVPRGWRFCRLSEEFNLTMGASPPGSTYNEEGIGLPFYQGVADFRFRFPERRVYCSEPKRTAEPGDTLVSVRAPVGRTNMAWERCCIGRGLAALRHRTGAKSFTYATAKHPAAQFDVYDREGTIFGSINKKDFANLCVITPPAELVTHFEQIVGPMGERIAVNTAQSRTLAELRDTLLPKLVSGEIRVPEAESSVESVL